MSTLTEIVWTEQSLFGIRRRRRVYTSGLTVSVPSSQPRNTVERRECRSVYRWSRTRTRIGITSWFTVAHVRLKSLKYVNKKEAKIVSGVPLSLSYLILLCKVLQTFTCFALEFLVFCCAFKGCLDLLLSFKFFVLLCKILQTFLCCFQPKGADRKHKTDREKMDKRTEAEKVNCFVTKPKLIDIIKWYVNIIGSDFFYSLDQ